MTPSLHKFEASPAQPWPAYTVERRSLAWLKPYPRNARTHGKTQIEQIRGSLKEFGWTMPVLAREDGTIIAGHGRVEAGKLEGMTEVPVIIATGWSETQCRAYALLDNRVPLNSGWDEQMLGLELQELSGLGVDLGTLGFDDIEIDQFANAEMGGNTDPDDIPESPSIPVSRLGDLWILGRHRLLCGDASKGEDIARLMSGQRADLILTDPPYGVAFEQGKYLGRDKAAKGPGFAPIVNDELKGEDLTVFITAVLTRAFDVSKDAPIYCWSPPLTEGGAILAGVQAAGFKVQSQIIWRKTPFVIGRADYHWQHEVCWYGFKGKGHAWYGGRDKGTVWDCPKPQKVDLHPTMKPVQLYATALENSSKGGDIVLDPLAGAGPLAIASQQLGRCAYMMEITPHYCDVIVRRWQEFAGEKAALDGDGRDFGSVAAERVPEAA